MKAPLEFENVDRDIIEVSVGTATVAMVLNGLGWSLRQLYLVPQFFAGHPRRTLGFGKESRRRGKSVDCLGRTLDWLYAHDLTKLFAGIASRAARFGVATCAPHQRWKMSAKARITRISGVHLTYPYRKV